MKKRVAFLDPGLKNLAYLILEFTDEDYEIFSWTKKDIIPDGKKMKNLTTQEIYDCVLDFMENSPDLRSCDMVFVELQMVSKFKAVTAIIYAQLGKDRCRLLSPLAVKRHFSLNHGNHALNKKAAVDWVTKDLAEQPAEYRTMFEKEKAKKDDLADCYLMFRYVQQRQGLCKTHLHTQQQKKNKRKHAEQQGGGDPPTLTPELTTAKKAKSRAVEQMGQ